MDDVRRIVRCEAHGHLVGVFAKRHLRLLDLYAGILRLESLDQLGPILACARLFRLPCREVQLDRLRLRADRRYDNKPHQYRQPAFPDHLSSNIATFCESTPYELHQLDARDDAVSGSRWDVIVTRLATHRRVHKVKVAIE